MFNKPDSILHKSLTSIKLFFFKVRQQKLKYLLSSILGVIGFLLSPISWWNDIFVNVPLAWLFAYGVTRFVFIFTTVSKLTFTVFFGIGYLLTNIIGFALLHASISAISNRETVSHKKQLLISLIYTAGFLLLVQLDIVKLITPALSIFPSFVF